MVNLLPGLKQPFYWTMIPWLVACAQPETVEVEIFKAQSSAFNVAATLTNTLTTFGPEKKTTTTEHFRAKSSAFILAETTAATVGPEKTTATTEVGPTQNQPQLPLILQQYINETVRKVL